MANTTEILEASNGHPTLVLHELSNRMAEISQGKMVPVDPNNSVAVMMEAFAQIGSGILNSVGAEARMLYRNTINDYHSLYRHMADKDYEARFARPAQNVAFNLALDYDTLLAKAVIIPGGGGRRKLTLPANTTITINNIPFTIEFQTDIYVLPHGALTVLHNGEEVNTLKTLSSNKVGWTIIQGELEANSNRSGKLVLLSLLLDQYGINRKIVSLSSLTSFKQTFNYEDKYFHCRAYMRDINGKWHEIKTTHQDTVYDPNTPTVCIRVLNDSIVVTIPQIYFNTNRIGTDIRLDIYTTKGPIDIDLSKFDIGQYNIEWKEIDKTEESIYIAPFKSFQQLAITSIARAKGGSNGATFAELRERVIGRSRANEEPIHEKNLPIKTALLDYDIVLRRDNISERTFVATRSLSAPATKDTVTGMDTSMMPFYTRLTDLLGNRNASKHGDLITLRPNMLFRYNNGMIDVLPDQELNNLLNPAINPPEKLIASINNDRLMFTPFHYVVDVSTNLPRCRAYVMNRPKIAITNFVQDNDSAGITLSALQKQIWMKQDGSGYILAVQIDPSTFPQEVRADQIGLQLSHRIAGGNRRIYYHGHLTRVNNQDLIIDPVDPVTRRPIDNQWVYYFFINTPMDVDQTNYMTAENYGGALGILDELDLIYYTVNYRDMDFLSTGMDTLLQPREIPGYLSSNLYSALTHERLTVEFGQHLEHLWSRVRTVKDSEDFETYANDVPLLYETDVFELNEAGVPKLRYNATTGKYERNRLHYAGDVVRDPSGEIIYKHHRDDYVLDGDGKRIAKGGALSPIREIDLFLLNGVYYFANDVATETYRQECVDLLASWITGEIPDLAEKFYAKSQLYYYPKRNLGHVKVVVGNQVTTSIVAEQDLVVTLYVPKDVFANAELRNYLEQQVPVVIDQVFQNVTISKSDCTDALKEALKDHVMSVDLSGLFEDQYSIVSVVDESVRPTIRKKLQLTRNQTVMVGNGIDVRFEVHART